MPNRLRILLATLAVVLFVALYRWDPWGDEPVPSGVAAAGSAIRTGPAAMDPHADSAERAYTEQLAREWLGPQRWHVGAYSDSAVEFIPVSIADTSATDIARAFVTLGALRDSAAEIELVGGAGRRAMLAATNLDSVVRVGARDNAGGCSIPLMLPIRRGVADTAGFVGGFVPGEVTLLAPADTNAVVHRDEALRLLAALPDSEVDRALRDSLGAAAWSAPSLELWRADSLELLVASRRRAVLADGKSEHWVEEELVIAERPTGSTAPFARTYGWHSAYDTDETSSMWIVTGLRVGARRRFVFLTGFEGKESSGGSLLVRGADGGWHDAVNWSTGC